MAKAREEASREMTLQKIGGNLASGNQACFAGGSG